MVEISVVMPTYNTAVDILKDAVESILGQTYGGFEFIIIDEGSENGSCAYLNALSDERIRLIRNPGNFGVTKSLNIGFAAAKGRYIARMDADDVAYPKRLEKQLAYMKRHPDVIVCGTNVRYIGDAIGVSAGRIRDMESYRIRALFRNPGPIHSTAFFDREQLLRHHLTYDETLPYAQDYGLWVEIAEHGKVSLLPEVMQDFRIHAQQVTRTKREKQIQCDQATQKKLLDALLGSVSDEELQMHYAYSRGDAPNAEAVRNGMAWFERLIAANAKKRIYEPRKFKRFVRGCVCVQLIRGSLPKSATVLQKMKAYLRYIPLSTVAWTLAGTCVAKCRRALQAAPTQKGGSDL